jgi:hypothetical protein
MDIKGLDYNTGREKLLMPEYGREIQKMVDHATTLSSREERLNCARAIVKMMETKVPQVRENADYEQTLWDHLFLMSHKQLDIDWPFDVSGAEKIHSKPQPMKLPQEQIHQRHYGRLVAELCEKLKQMPDDTEERELLVRYTANQMKRDLLTWGHGSVDDEKVADDLARFTDGVIQLDLNRFSFGKISPLNNEEIVKKGKKKK